MLHPITHRPIGGIQAEFPIIEKVPPKLRSTGVVFGKPAIRRTAQIKPIGHGGDSDIVRAAEKRGPATMGLLWLTMVTAFPSMLIGFEWNKAGITISQILICSLLSCAVLLIYTVPIAYLSAKTGRGYGVLNQFLFGNRCAAVINCLLILIFTSFYGLTALLMADAVAGLFHLNIPSWLLACGFAVLMAFNNFFGFSGIANFARYLAAPVIIGWVLVTFAKVAPATPTSLITQASTQSFLFAFGTVSSFIVGFAVWGNEADYWRYGKPKVSYSLIGLIPALLIGQVLFPITGYMVAHMTGISEFGKAMAYVTSYSFGGIAIIAALVVGASYFACNDSNLYGSAANLHVLAKIRHRTAVIGLTVFSVIMALWLSLLGASKAVESVLAANSVILPVATVLVLAEWFLSTRRGCAPFSRGGSSRAAVIAVSIAIAVGIATAGIIPQLEVIHLKLAWLLSWTLSLSIFVPLRLLEYRAISLVRLPETESGQVNPMAQLRLP